MRHGLPDWHYYESHVTIEPVFDKRLDLFIMLCRSMKFHVADLLMKKRANDKPVRSSLDSFCTSRSDDYKDISLRTVFLVNKLKDEGFKVYRYKIESTLVDSRYDDEFGLL
jgi:hypothetical protein